MNSTPDIISPKRISYQEQLRYDIVFFIISFIHPIICVFFFAHTGDFNPIKSKKWVVRRSRLPELQTRGIVKSLSQSESLVWWKKPTSWAFCATVKSRSLSSIRITSSSNMHPQTWTKCSSSIQVYLHQKHKGYSYTYDVTIFS